MNKFGRFIPLHVWCLRYVKKRFGRFVPLRLYHYGVKGKGQTKYRNRVVVSSAVDSSGYEANEDGS